jgi:hypothetical protein
MVNARIMERQRLSEMIAFRVYPALYEVVTKLATRERRKLSEVELALFERGVAAFQRDGLLFEPQEYKKLPVANTAPEKRKATSGPQKKTGTSNR